MIFIGGYLPGQKYGGPVTSIYNFTEAFGDDYDIRIVCCDHDFGSSVRYSNITDGWNRVGKAQVRYLADEACDRKHFRAIFEEEKPDVIYGSGIMHFKFNAPMLLEAKKQRIPVLLAPRGDICENALKIKAWKKVPFLKAMKLTKFFDGVFFHATMQEEKDNLLKYLNVKEDKVFILPNMSAVATHRKNYTKDENMLRIIFISRIQSKKNLLAAIKAVNGMHKNAVFDIYGPLENEEYWDQCQKEIAKSPENVKILYKGALAPQEAKNIYTNYDCFLFPTLSENYGHVIAEALLHDCPIIISKGTTPWDDVAVVMEECVQKLDDIEGFTNCLDKMSAMNNEQYQVVLKNLRQYTEHKFDTDALKAQYVEMFNQVFQ